MRRALLLLVVVGLAGCGGGGRTGGTPATRADAEPVPPGPRWPAPERYSLALAYDAGRFALSGSERIALRNSGPGALRSVWLRTWGNAFGGCGRRSVRVAVTGGGRAGAERAPSGRAAPRWRSS